MAFVTSSLSTWSQELANRQDWILKPILGSRFMDYITDKRYGITGQNVRIPNFESTSPAQAGTACGFTTSGSTTLTQTTITTVPIKVQEQICLQDLETFFAQQTLPGTSMPETFDLLELWVNRKLANISRRLGSMAFQGRTTYTNDSWLKQTNGFIRLIDNAADEIVATAQSDINTTTVRGIFEDVIFTRMATIPAILMNNPIVYCGQDTFLILLNKLMVDNLYHVPVGSNLMGSMELVYPGSNIKIVALPELNSSNAVETGALPTAVQDRIIATYQDNLVVGLNATDSLNDFDVWYSKDDQVLKFNWRAHVGFAIKHTDHVITYANS